MRAFAFESSSTLVPQDANLRSRTIAFHADFRQWEGAEGVETRLHVACRDCLDKYIHVYACVCVCVCVCLCI